jgi:hypothetical protein
MKTPFRSSVTAFITAVVAAFMLSCGGPEDGSPVSPVDHYGYVEGFVTIDGKPADSVDIIITSAALLPTPSLAKKTMQQPQTADSLGYFRVSLVEGTYDLGFQKTMSGRTIRMKKYVGITAGQTLSLNVDFSDVLDTLRITTIGLKTVSINWLPYASYYQVFRSKDSILWSFVPGTQISPSGKKTYTVSYPPAIDTIPDFGTYYYKVCGFSATDSLIYQLKIKKFSCENSPPPIKAVTLSDSIRYLYGSVLLAPGYTDYGRYSIIVLRGNGSATATRFDAYDTVATNSLYAALTNSSQYFFRDSACDTGYYLFRFLAVETSTGKTGDTSQTYSVKYGKSAPLPVVSLSDNMQYVTVSINRADPGATPAAFQIVRSVGDTTGAVVIDTVFFLGTSFAYLDYTAESDTCFYAVRQLCGDSTNCTHSKFTGIVHSSAPPAPGLYSPVDSGTYIRLQVNPSVAGFPMIIFRASAKDTIAIDTIVPVQTSTYVLRDYPPVPGFYSYAAAHLDSYSAPGKKSPWITIYFKNAPPTPVLSITQTNGLSASLKIGPISNISGIVIKRTEATRDSVQKTDTIHSSEFVNYELTPSSPQSLIYLDTLTSGGTFFYTVSTFNINGTSSREVSAGLYLPAQLPPPPSPTATVSDLCISLTMPLSITGSTADSIKLFRAKDSLANFTLLRTVSVLWTNSFTDSVYSSGAARYFYKIQTIRAGIRSEYSAPVEVYYSGILSAPPAVRLGADSTVVKITIPPCYSPADSLVLYRSAAGSGDLTRIAKNDTAINKECAVLDSVGKPGNYTYKTMTFYRTLRSRFSAEKSIAVPGTGFRIFLAPKAGDTLKIGSSVSIQFNASLIDGRTVSVFLYKGTSPITTVAVLSAGREQTAFTWNPPATVTPGTGYYLLISDYYTDESIDRSPEFSIAAP